MISDVQLHAPMVIEHNISVTVMASCPQWLTGDNNKRRLAKTEDGE